LPGLRAGGLIDRLVQAMVKARAAGDVTDA